MSVVARAAALEGQGPRALPERRAARPARVVCHPRRRRRRRGSSSARTSPTLPRRGGDDRRRDPGAVAALAVQQPRARQGAPQRRPAGDGRHRVHPARTTPTARRASRCRSSARALESEAPHFVDYLTQELAGAVRRRRGAVDVYSTLDLHLQRLAQDAVRDGLTPRRRASSRSGKPRLPQAALIAIDPRTGEILALVGGRSYNQSQFNRAISAKRQPGSVFKPFVYLAAFERAEADGRTDITPATLVVDEPTTFTFNDQDVDAGQLRQRVRRPDHAAPRARATRATSPPSRSPSRPASTTSRRSGGSSASARRRKGYPSIALGVFEATPFEIATAYTVFPNGGTIRPLRAIDRIVGGGKDLPIERAAAEDRRAARTRPTSSPT